MPTWKLAVPAGDFARAQMVLEDHGLPHKAYASIGQVFKREGLVSTPSEERIRFIDAQQQELANTLSQLDGVITARVHVVIPQNDPLADKVKPASASVFIKHRPEVDLNSMVPPDQGTCRPQRGGPGTRQRVAFLVSGAHTRRRGRDVRQPADGGCAGAGGLAAAGRGAGRGTCVGCPGLDRHATQGEGPAFLPWPAESALHRWRDGDAPARPRARRPVSTMSAWVERALRFNTAPADYAHGVVVAPCAGATGAGAWRAAGRANTGPRLGADHRPAGSGRPGRAGLCAARQPALAGTGGAAARAGRGTGCGRAARRPAPLRGAQRRARRWSRAWVRPPSRLRCPRARPPGPHGPGRPMSRSRRPISKLQQRPGRLPHAGLHRAGSTGARRPCAAGVPARGRAAGPAGA